MGESDFDKAREFAHQIGPAFVKQFYTCLAGTSLNRHDAFYGVNSSFSCNGEAPILGAAEIKEQYVKLGFKEVLVDLEGGTFDFIPSHEGGVLVVVAGSMTFGGDEAKSFTQTFFLAPDEVDGNVSYFVMNDILRFGEASAVADEQLDAEIVDETDDTQEIEAVADEEVTKEGEQVVVEGTTVGEEVSNEEAETETVETSKPLEEMENVDEKAGSDAEIPEVEASVDVPVKQEPPAPKPQAKPSSWAALVSQSNAQPVQAPVKQSAPKSSTTKSKPNKSGASTRTSANGTKGAVSASLFVKEVEKGAKEEDLKQVFKQYGAIKSVEIFRERKFAFVTFESPGSAKEALAAPKITLLGKTLTVQQRTSHGGGRSDGRRGNRSSRGNGRDRKSGSNTNGSQNGPAKSRNRKN